MENNITDGPKKLPQAFHWSGIVVHGEQIGRTIGFPTANVSRVPTIEQLETGVYFGSCEIGEQHYFCLPYFGPRSVFGEVHNVFEVYIFGLSTEIYDQEISVELTHFLRSPKKASSLDALKVLLEQDKAAGLKLIESQ